MKRVEVSDGGIWHPHSTTKSQRGPFDEDELVPRSSVGGEAVLEEQEWEAITGNHFFNTQHRVFS